MQLRTGAIASKSDSAVGGTQSVSRALTLLKFVSTQHEHGIELNRLVDETGLDRTTAYRLLNRLVASGFVERDAASKKYRLGIESMQLGLIAMSRAPILEKCRPAMQLLARQTEDTVFLVIRNGDYGHCLHLESGNFPIKAMTLLVGGLRLLGMGAAGQALLATRSLADIEALYQRHRAEYDATGMGLLQMRKLITLIQKTGFSETDGLINEGVRGVGVSFEFSRGNYAAISVAAISARMDQARRHWIAGEITEQVRKLGFTPVTYDSQTG